MLECPVMEFSNNHRNAAIIGDSNPINEDDIARALAASDPEISSNTSSIMH